MSAYGKDFLKNLDFLKLLPNANRAVKRAQAATHGCSTTDFFPR